MTIEISNLGSHTGKPANTDVLALVDVSDTTQAASGSTKKVSYADLVTGLLTTSAAASTYQPLDSDLTALAALTTTSFGRSLLELADAGAGRTALELGTAAQVDTGTSTGNVPTIDDADARYQPIDSDLTAIAALTTSAFGRSLLESADAAAARTLIDVDEAGTAVAQVTAHTDDATDAHDASAISVTDAGDYFTSTDVEGALQEAGADIAALSSGAVSDGDKGDITVSGSGATWTIDDNAVSLAKLADIATASILGRTTAATGDPEVLTATQVRTLLNVEDGATADQSAAEILTAIKTVDGTGSGLDADLLDGNEATAFATEAQGTLADSAVQPGDTIPIVDGGTGAQSAAVARTNLSVYSIAEVDAEIDALSGTYVALTGDQSVAGIKTFTSSPVVPAPTTDLQAATKKYVDDNAGGGGGSHDVVPINAWVTGSIYVGSIPSVEHATGGLMCIPRYITHECTLDALGCRNDAAKASSVFRMGLYDTDTATGLPGDLIVDAGTVDLSATTGIKTITGIGQVLSPGLYWFAGVLQGDFVSMWGVPRGVQSYAFLPNSTTGAGSPTSASAFPSQSGVTGALPSSFSGDWAPGSNAVFWISGRFT